MTFCSLEIVSMYHEEWVRKRSGVTFVTPSSHILNTHCGIEASQVLHGVGAHPLAVLVQKGGHPVETLNSQRNQEGIPAVSRYVFEVDCVQNESLEWKSPTKQHQWILIEATRREIFADTKCRFRNLFAGYSFYLIEQRWICSGNVCFFSQGSCGSGSNWAMLTGRMFAPECAPTGGIERWSVSLTNSLAVSGLCFRPSIPPSVYHPPPWYESSKGQSQPWWATPSRVTSSPMDIPPPRPRQHGNGWLCLCGETLG